jgi:flagellar basal body-associated protein FliL
MVNNLNLIFIRGEMKVKIRCPNCDQKLEGEPGQNGTCLNCGAEITIPEKDSFFIAFSFISIIIVIMVVVLLAINSYNGKKHTANVQNEEYNLQPYINETKEPVKQEESEEYRYAVEYFRKQGHNLTNADDPVKAMQLMVKCYWIANNNINPDINKQDTYWPTKAQIDACRKYLKSTAVSVLYSEKSISIYVEFDQYLKNVDLAWKEFDLLCWTIAPQWPRMGCALRLLGANIEQTVVFRYRNMRIQLKPWNYKRNDCYVITFNRIND